MSKPYTDHQVLFFSDINKNYDYNIQTVPVIHVLNKIKVPMYWQINNKLIKLTEKDHEYLKDIENLRTKISIDKTRSQKNLELVDMLLDKYNIKTTDEKTIDKETIYRSKLIPRIVNELNTYFKSKYIKDINPEDSKKLLVSFLKMMKFGNNTITMIIGAAEDANFFHPLVAPVEWTGMIKDLVYGNVDDAIEHIKYATPDPRKIEWIENSRFDFVSKQKHVGTGMAGDDD